MRFRVMRLNDRSKSHCSSRPGFAGLCSLFVVPLLLVSLAIPALAGNKVSQQQGDGEPSAEQQQQCFCQLDSNPVEDCGCSAQTIEQFNKEKIHDELMKLLHTNYFRFFQVDLNRPCLIWPDDQGQCGSRTCNVETCPESELPPDVAATLDKHKQDRDTEHESYLQYFRQKIQEFVPLLGSLFAWSEKGEMPSCDEQQPEYSRVDTAVPQENIRFLNEFCTLDPLESSESCDFIDLLKNEEKYTGYAGPSANRVWSKIYSELCFPPDQGGELTGEAVKGMCAEKRAFYRIVSGLHTSITVHLCRSYLLQESNPLLGKPAVWGPNVEEFRRRFDPVLTSGEGTGWLRNIYFLYLLELEAVARAAPLLTAMHFGPEDEALRASLQHVVSAAASFPSRLNTATLFNPEDLTKAELLAEVKAKFRQISHMMDCMGCERCKVWGKLQVTGVGTALKILFSPPDTLTLSRHEVVALLNAFGRVATSLTELETFRNLIQLHDKSR